MSNSGNRYRLVIGDKAWSSWSLRPWLVLKRFGLAFEEVHVGLRRTDSKARILAHSPAGKVPALFDGDLLVWDSLAITEYLADRHPALGIWPKNPEARAIARAVSAEMHAGFQALREHCPMDFLVKKPMQHVPEPVELNIRRIVASWRDCRHRFGGEGPFLFGRFSAADAMYAPVASRFETYVPSLAPFGDDGTAAAYQKAVLGVPELAEWAEGARRELAAPSIESSAGDDATG